MARKLGDRENFRVVINPHSAFWLFAQGKPQDQITCEHIAEDVKRHVDNVGAVTVEFDQEPICEHCGATWTEDSSAYNGGCCDADEEANPARDRDASLAEGAIRGGVPADLTIWEDL